MYELFITAIQYQMFKPDLDLESLLLTCFEIIAIIARKRTYHRQMPNKR